MKFLVASTIFVILGDPAFMQLLSIASLLALTVCFGEPPFVQLLPLASLLALSSEPPLSCAACKDREASRHLLNSEDDDSIDREASRNLLNLNDCDSLRIRIESQSPELRGWRRAVNRAIACYCKKRPSWPDPGQRRAACKSCHPAAIQ